MASRLLALGTSRRILRYLTLGPAAGFVWTTTTEHLSRPLPKTLTLTQTRRCASATFIFSPSPKFIRPFHNCDLLPVKDPVAPLGPVCPVLPPGEKLRDMPFSEADLENDDTIWRLYERWLQFHGFSPSPWDKLTNYSDFETTARGIRRSIKKGRTPKYGFNQYADQPVWPVPADHKPKGLCLKCLARCIGSQLKDLKEEYDESGKRKVTVAFTEREDPDLLTACCPPQDSGNTRQR